MQPITVTVDVHIPRNDMWWLWTAPAHIMKWNQASADWECPHAENDLRVGGNFLAKMSAKDGSASFDFTGTYTEVIPLQKIAYSMSDGRNVSVLFEEVTPTTTRITETFDPENVNPVPMQQEGWQAILESCKAYAEDWYKKPAVLKKVHLSIEIEAPRERVWQAITTREEYEVWTKVFMPTSSFDGGWNTGDKILFTAINDNGKKEGMVSEIAESRVPEYISIRHLGFVSEGVEDTTSPAIKRWAPTYENYTLETIGERRTRFTLDMDAEETYADMMHSMWQQALEILKKLCEGK